MNLQEAREILFKNKELRAIRVKNRLKYQMADLVFEARISKKMTQTQLAKKIGTKQPSIARIENGDVLPSLEFLDKIAKALDTELVQPMFKFMEEKEIELKSYQARSEIVVSAKMLGNNYYLLKCPFSYELKDGSYDNSFFSGVFAKNGGLND